MTHLSSITPLLKVDNNFIAINIGAEVFVPSLIVAHHFLSLCQNGVSVLSEAAGLSVPSAFMDGFIQSPWDYGRQADKNNLGNSSDYRYFHLRKEDGFLYIEYRRSVRETALQAGQNTGSGILQGFGGFSQTDMRTEAILGVQGLGWFEAVLPDNGEERYRITEKDGIEDPWSYLKKAQLPSKKNGKLPQDWSEKNRADIAFRLLNGRSFER